jgi:hypothetical protein
MTSWRIAIPIFCYGMAVGVAVGFMIGNREHPISEGVYLAPSGGKDTDSIKWALSSPTRLPVHLLPGTFCLGGAPIEIPRMSHLLGAGVGLTRLDGNCETKPQ